MNFLSGIQRLFSEWRKNLTPKKVILYIVAILLFITPTVWAGIYAYRMDYVAQADSYSVTLYDSENREIAHDSGDPELAKVNSLVRIFHAITSNMKQVTKSPGDPAHDPFIRAIVDLNGTKTELACYFSFIDTANYCIDKTGKIYTVSATDVATFLASPYAEPFYSEATAPSLITADNDSVLPSSLTWYYKNYDGNFLLTQRNQTVPDMHLYDIAEAIDVRFNREPDYCLAQVYQEGTLIYEGSHKDLSALTVKAGSELSIVLRATWNSKVSSLSYGELLYHFGVRIRNHSTFSLNATAVTKGGFAVLTCTNITDPSKIIFTSKNNYKTPSFHPYGDRFCAILPIAKDIDTETLSFSVTYGASTEIFTIHITEKASQSFSFPKLNLKETPAFSSDAMTEWQRLLQSTAQKSDTPIYFRGNFLDPVANDFSVGYTNDSKVYWGGSYSNPYIALGTEFVTEEVGGTCVQALNHGVVTHTGSCALLGNYVVVDHGGGLRTWYGHLSTVNVFVGDVLAKGDEIGQTGSGGVATDNGFLLICTIYDTVIDPEILVGKEFTIS